MLSFVLRRLASGVALVVAMTSITYLLLYLSGGDIARTILGEQATAETVALKKQELGLDQPLLTRFGDWVSNALQGDLGVSWFSGQPVTEALTSRLAVTLSLVIGATVVSPDTREHVVGTPPVAGARATRRATALKCATACGFARNGSCVRSVGAGHRLRPAVP